jgi:hypothetical protein
LTLVQDLSRCCSSRLEAFGKWVGIATLRSLELGAVPEELQAEPVNGTHLLTSGNQSV